MLIFVIVFRFLKKIMYDGLMLLNQPRDSRLALPRLKLGKKIMFCETLRDLSKFLLKNNEKLLPHRNDGNFLIANSTGIT